MYVLSDDDMVSHCYWKNDEEIIAFENKCDGGTGYYLMKDKTQEYNIYGLISAMMDIQLLTLNDGTVIFDSYPDKRRMQEIKIASDKDIDGKDIKLIARCSHLSNMTMIPVVTFTLDGVEMEEGLLRWYL
jgi:hypothetical protein